MQLMDSLSALGITLVLVLVLVSGAPVAWAVDLYGGELHFGGSVAVVTQTYTQFSGITYDADGNLVLYCDQPPTAVMNFPYQYSDGALTLIDNGATAELAVDFSPLYGNLRIESVTGGYLTDSPSYVNELSFAIDGPSGGVATFKLYCGDLGKPYWISWGGAKYSDAEWSWDPNANTVTEDVSLSSPPVSVVVVWEDSLTFSDITVSGGTADPSITVTVKHEYDGEDACFDADFPLKAYVGGVEVGSATGTGQLTLNLTGVTLHGSGNITLQGSDALYGVPGSLEIPYDISVSNLYAGDQSVVEGHDLTFQVGWSNTATVNGQPTEIENCQLRVYVLSGDTAVLSQTVDVGVSPPGDNVQEVTLDTSGLGIGTYTLRVALYQLGSEYLLAQADSVLNVVAEEAPAGGGGGGLVVPPPTYALSLSSPTLTLKPGRSALVMVELSYPRDIVSLTLNDVSFMGPYADWCNLELTLPATISRLTVSSQEWGTFKIPVRVILPGDALPGTYTIPVKASLTTSGGTALEVSSALTVEVPTQTAPQETVNMIGVTIALVAATVITVPIILRSRE